MPTGVVTSCLFLPSTPTCAYAGELSCSPSGDKSRPRLTRLSEPPTLEDLEISTVQEQAGERLPMPARPAQADLPTPKPFCSSYPLADLTPDSDAGSPQVNTNTKCVSFEVCVCHKHGSESMFALVRVCIQAGCNWQLHTASSAYAVETAIPC